MQFLDKSPSNKQLQRVEETPEASAIPPESFQKSGRSGDEANPALMRVQFGVHTPVLYKKVVCPSNLEFDSEPSSGAEWSLSMVTPATKLTVQESPPSFTTTTTTEEDEEREVDPTTDESVLELRNVLHTGASSKKQRRSSLKFLMKAEKGGRSVVRTLFPARFSAIDKAVKSSDVNPLSHPLQSCGSSSSVSNARKEESNIGKEEATVHRQQSISCSQELFGTPVCVIPASPPTSPTAEKILLNDNGGETIENVSFVGKTPKMLHNGYLLVHSTPLCSNQSRRSKVLHSVNDNLSDKRDDLAPLTANAVHQEPTCHSAMPVAALSCSLVVAETPCRNADISNRSESFNFTGGGDDVLDVLFMSSSQLESHFNLQDSQQHSEETVRITSTEVQPSDEIYACLTNLDDRLPKETEEKYDVKSASKKMQVTNFSCTRSKKMKCRRSRIRTRATTCAKNLSGSGNAITCSSLPLCTTKRAVDGGGDSRIGHVLREPLAKKWCSDMDGEEIVQKNSDEEGCEIEADCCVGGCGDRQGDCEEKNILEEAKERAKACEEEMELAEEENGDQGEVTGDMRDFNDGNVLMDVSELIASITKEYQSSVVIKCPENCMKNDESLDEHPKRSQPGTVKEVKSEIAQHVDLASLGQDASSKVEAKVSTLDTVTLSPIPVIKMRHMRVPGLSRSAQKQKLTKKVSVQFLTRNDQVAEDLPFVSTTPVPASCVSESGSFVGFKTAAGSSIPISTAALDKAKKLMDTGFDDDAALDGGAYMDISYQSLGIKTDALQGNVMSLKQSALLGLKVNPKYRTPNSSISFPLAASSLSHYPPAGSATYPRMKGPPMKRQRSKGFRAPRMASDVSKEEERGSLSRILKGFRVSTASASPINSGFSCGNGNTLAVSHNAVLKARELFFGDRERVSYVETNKNSAWNSRNGASMHNDFSNTSFQAADGKDVMVSSKALKRKNELVAEGSQKECGLESWMNIDGQSTSESSHCTATWFKTAGRKGISVSCNALKKAQEMVAEGNQKISGLELPMELDCGEMGTLESSTCTGFKTAGGKKISVSSNALKKAQEMVAEGSQKVSGLELPMELDCGETGTLESSTCTGFKTAGGKKISVSSNALKKAQEMVAEGSQKVSGLELPMELDCGETGTLESSTCTGFKTAGGKKISVSSNALKKAQEMVVEESMTAYRLAAQMELESVERTATSEPSAYTAPGFKTADGSTLSLESLQRVEMADQVGTEECVVLSEQRQDILEHCSPCKPVTTGMDHISIDVKMMSKNPASGNDDSSSCYFSTQVVRQLLNFSSGEESSADDSILNNSYQACEKIYSHSTKEETMDDAARDCVKSNLVIVSPLRQQRETGGYDLSKSEVGYMETSSMSSWLPFEDSVCRKAASSQSFCESSSVSVPTMACGSVTLSPSNGRAESDDGRSPAPTTHQRISAPVDEDKGYCQPKLANPMPLSTGFTTAGGRSTDIPTVALQNAKPSFLSLASPLPKVTEWSSEGASVSTVGMFTVLHQNNESDEEKDKCSRVHGDDIETHCASVPYPGLQTANEKKVEVNEEATIRAAKATLGCITAPFDSQQHQQSFTDRTANEISKLMSMAEPLGADEAVGASDHGVSCFQTASGRMEISGESVRRTKLFLGEPNGQQLRLMDSFHVAGGTKVELSENLVKAAKKELGECCDKEFSGFQTGGGKMVEISEESIREAKTALEEPNNERVNSFCGFLTAGGKKVESEESIKAAKTALEEPNNERINSFRGFQTAGGKKVEISEESTKAAKTALEEPNNERVNSFRGFQTAGGKVEISEESIKAAKTALEEPNNERVNSFRGFQTAGGKKVEISEESIKAAKTALEEPNNERVNSFRGFQTAGGKKVEISEESIKAAKTALEEPNNERVNSFRGFQTAGGKKVEISEESIKAAKTALEEPNNERVNSFLGFQTAGGKKVEISEESIKAAKTALEEPNNERVNSYQTAGGKKVEISNKSIRAAEGSSVPILDTRKRSNMFPSLQSASGKHVEINKQSLQAAGIALGEYGAYPTIQRTAKSHAILSSEELDTGKDTIISKSTLGTAFVGSVPFSGLQTVSGCKADVSYRSVELARSVLGTACASNDVYRTTERSGDCTSHLCRLRVNEQTARVSRKSRTSIPEATLCDRIHPGRGALQPQLSLPPDNIVNSSASNQSLYSNKNTSGCPTPYNRNIQLFNIPQQNPTFTSAQLQPQAFNHRTSSHHFPYQTVPFMAKSLADNCSSLSPTFASAYVSCPHSHPRQSTQHNRCSYTVPSKTNFNTPMKGKSMNNYICPGLWKTPLSHHQRSRPLRHDSTLKAIVRAESSIQQEETTLSVDSDSLAHHLHITLSQVYEMEDSQNQGEFESRLQKETSSVTGGRLVNDSGFVSREISTFKSPSPCQEHRPASSDPTLALRRSTEDLTDTLFAEVAMEDIEDTLEDCSHDGCVTSPISSATTSITLDDRDVEDAMSSSGALKSVDEATNTEHMTKPQCGSLLELRLEHKSSRVALRDAVCCELPRRRSVGELSAFGVPSYAQDLTSDNAKNFRFPVDCFSSGAVRDRCSVCVGDGASLALTRGSAGVDEFWDAFRTSPGVDLKLISYEWFVNHFRHLTVKLASMEQMYPQFFAGRCLTPDWLMFQLKYRYDRGIDGAERSAIHRICEHDDLPSRRMVLYVSKMYSSSTILPRDESSLATAELSCCRNTHHDETRLETKLDPPSLVLSDGWYDLPCVLDRPLRHMLRSGKIRVGTKLVVYGAELLGLTSPCHPLEVPITCCLKISANSTRRALWDARLGFQPCSFPFPLPLEYLFADGGLVGSVSAVIARVYPMAYLEKKDGSKNVMRCVRVEEKEAVRYAREREKMTEDVFLRVRTEFENDVARQDFPPCKRRRSCRLNTMQVKQLQDGQDIYNALVNAPDPQATQELLSDTQRAYLESYQLSVAAERQAELQRRVKVAIQEAEDTMPPQREVIPLLRLRLVPTTATTTTTTGSVAACGNDLDCQLSIWRPHDHLQQIREGTIMKMSNVTANPSKYHTSRLQLTSSRSTRYETLSSETHPSQVNYLPRQIFGISELGSLSASQVPYKEFDTVGLVAHFSTSSCLPRHPDDSGYALDMICLVDLSGILLVKAWGGVKSFGLEELISLGVVLCFSNLCHRGDGTRGYGSGAGSRHCHHPVPPWPAANLTDITVVSQNPKDIQHKTALARFKQQLPANKDLFLEKWAVEIRTYL